MLYKYAVAGTGSMRKQVYLEVFLHIEMKYAQFEIELCKGYAAHTQAFDRTGEDSVTERRLDDRESSARPAGVAPNAWGGTVS